MAYTEEPTIRKGGEPEKTFHKAIKNEIEEILNKSKLNGKIILYFILENFGLDLCVCTKCVTGDFSIKFIEIKAFVESRKNAVGFGDSRGDGSQVDLLCLEDTKLNLANSFIRWVMVDAHQQQNNLQTYAIFDNAVAKSAAMKGARKGKQNNLRVNDIMRNSINWDDLSKELEKFIIS